MNILQSFTGSIFYLLFFLTPMLMSPWTSELFEFNKMSWIYLLTGLALISSGITLFHKKNLIIPPLPFSIALAIFNTVLLISTIYSVDTYTSLWGYYSRFHGGLISTLAYTALVFLLYYHQQTYSPKITNRLILVGILSATIISIYAIAQHFGIDDHLWRQDVKHRVFSSLGQPNWLAALIALILPFTWYSINSNPHSKKQYLFFGSSLLLFLALLYTRSRSGFLAVIIAYLIYISLLIFTKQLRPHINKVCVLTTAYLIMSLTSSTPFSQSLLDIRNTNPSQHQENIPALEGRTDSGIIRKIVWQGALKLGFANPLLGTGPETFAYTYYWARPATHNLVSEWDFLYNKAHNEYLNYFATTGALGLASYVLIIIAAITAVYRNIQASTENNRHLTAAIAASVTTILITNFFGFSVSVTDLWLYALPLFLPTMGTPIHFNKKFSIIAISITSIILGTLLIYSIINIYSADLHYTKAKNAYQANEYQQALTQINKSQQANPSQPLYYDLHSKIAAELAVIHYLNNQDITSAQDYADQAIKNSNLAITSSPTNSNFLKSRAAVLIILAQLNPQYYEHAITALEEGQYLAPTDPKMAYNIAIIKDRQNKTDEAILYLEQAVALKPNYTDALSTLANFQHQISVKDQKIIDKTRHDQAILTLKKYLQIAPNDDFQQQTLIQWEKEATASQK